METFNKLAGVQDASDLTSSSSERPSQPHVFHGESSQQTDSLPTQQQSQQDTTSNTSLTHRASRASVPLNRQPSHRSFRSNRSGRSSKSHTRENTNTHHPDGDLVPPVPALPFDQRQNHNQRPSHDSAAQSSTSSDFVWGPTHPCFPHPNPHCTPTSEGYPSTRVIRVRRDWLTSGDLYPQFANLYPEILDPLVTDSEFRFLISNLNSRLKKMFEPCTTRAWTDSLMGVLTGFLWDDFGFAGPKGEEKELEMFLEGWNEERVHSGVRVVQLRKTGFMSLDFVVPDPGIDGEVDEEGEGAYGEYEDRGREGAQEGGFGPAE